MKRHRDGMVREEVESKERNEKHTRINIWEIMMLCRSHLKEIGKTLKESKKERQKDRRQENHYTQKILKSRRKNSTNLANYINYQLYGVENKVCRDEQKTEKRGQFPNTWRS